MHGALFARVLYIEALAAPSTINTMPEETLLAFADHGKVNDVLPVDGGDAEEILAGFAKVGVDDAALAAQLQREGAQSFGKSWNELMDNIASKGQVPGKTTQTRAKR
jgi:transaldolase